MLFEFKDPETKEISWKEEPFVYCTDVTLFVKLLIDVEELEPSNQLIKIACDGGGGFIKFSMNIIDRNVDESPTKLSYLAKGMKHL